MSDRIAPPQIIIPLKALPYVPQEGYRYQAHETEPSVELRRWVYDVAEAILEQLGEHASGVVRLEFVFIRDNYPGGLKLTTLLTVDAAADIQVKAKVYNYSISLEPMRTADMLQRHLIDRLLQDLVSEIDRTVGARESANQDAVKWYETIGHPRRPQMSDLY